jgi:integrase
MARPFERAMLWGLIDLQRSPVELVKLKGTSKHLRKPQVVLPEKFRELTGLLLEPYRMMAIVAICTGLRVSEVLALRWEHIDFKSGHMLVQKGVVNGRIEKVKTDASSDYIPLNPLFAHVLRTWKGNRTRGLVFPSHVTGRCYHAGIIQQQILKPCGAQIGIAGLGWHTFRRHACKANGCIGVTRSVTGPLLLLSSTSSRASLWQRPPKLDVDNCYEESGRIRNDKRASVFRSLSASRQRALYRQSTA